MYSEIGCVTFALAVIFFGSHDVNSFVFDSVLTPIYLFIFLAAWSNNSGNFSIWCFFACLKKNGARFGILIFRCGCAPFRMISL